MHHVGLVAVVEALALALVVQLARRAVGRRRHRAAPLAAADDLGREVVDRHRYFLLRRGRGGFFCTATGLGRRRKIPNKLSKPFAAARKGA